MGAMKFIISGKNIEVTEGIKAAIEEKLGRVRSSLRSVRPFHFSGRTPRGNTAAWKYVLLPIPRRRVAVRIWPSLRHRWSGRL